MRKQWIPGHFSLRIRGLGTRLNQPIPKLVIKKFGMEHCKPANTPVTPGTKLLKGTEQSEIVDATLYQSAVGSLLHLSGWTRPDIAFAVSHVARFCSSPTKEHWIAVKRILRYLKGTPNYGLTYSSNVDTDGPLIRYSDANWAGDVNDCINPPLVISL